MKKKIILLLILITITNFLSGCWSKREIDELSIAMGIGIDKIDNEYLITVQLINPSEITVDTSSTRTAVTIYQTRGKTIFEAFRKLTQKTPRKVYLSHIQTIVFGEEFAKNGIAKALDFFSRDHELRTDFYILVSRRFKAEDILSILTPLEKIPAKNMHTSLQMSEQSWAATYHIELDELIKILVSDGKNPVLTGITISGDVDSGTAKENIERIKPFTTVQIDHIAVFRGDKLVGWLNEDESKGFNFINDNVESTIINIPCLDNQLISLEIVRSKTKLKCKVENGEPRIYIDVTAESNIGEVQCDSKILETKSIYEFEENAEKIIKDEMEVVIEKAKTIYKSDIFGFGEAIHRADPKLWKELKDGWDDKFANLPVNMNVDVKIRRLGTISESFQNEIKE